MKKSSKTQTKQLQRSYLNSHLRSRVATHKFVAPRRVFFDDVSSRLPTLGGSPIWKRFSPLKAEAPTISRVEFRAINPLRARPCVARKQRRKAIFAFTHGKGAGFKTKRVFTSDSKIKC